ncbi:MAG: hypothetical protein KGV59_04945 [Tenacibaculum sp.]|nr:hypothetical protein [Tenacibaculum sp.]
MKKAWFILVSSCVIFLGLKYVLPKEYVYDYFLKNTGNQFEELLSNQIQDTINQQRIADSLALVEQKRLKELAEKEQQKFDSIEKIIKYKNVNRNGLQLFFEKLYDLENNKKKQIRIAFFGDSMEDADMIIMQFRHFLQQRFGGKGVGFVPITSVTANGRYSIKHRFTNTWEEVSFMNKGFGRFAFGLNGKTFFVGNDSIEKEASVTYKKGSAYKNLPLINPTLFYGKSIIDSTYIGVSATYTKDSILNKIYLKPVKTLNVYRFPNYPKKLTITIKDKQTIPFYGVSFASKKGIIVDNLAIRGNSGLPLSKLNITLMQQFNKYFNYDLVILAYGTNVFSFKRKKYEWYKRSMLRNIRHIQKCFPNSNILVSSMGDRSMKIDGVMQTPEHLPDFINLQYEIAKDSKSGFYNLYKEMGGKNSMVEWVENNLANKDYTHFNPEGAEEAGYMMYQWLMKHYNETISKKKEKIND